MSKVALIKINHVQMLVEEDKVYSVPKFDAEVGNKIEIDEVLMIKTENPNDLEQKNQEENQNKDNFKNNPKKENIVFGKPYIENAKVIIEVLSHDKGEKIVTKVYKAKSRYRRTKGFRKQLTRFKVVSITF